MYINLLIRRWTMRSYYMRTLRQKKKIHTHTHHRLRFHICFVLSLENVPQVESFCTMTIKHSVTYIQHDFFKLTSTKHSYLFLLSHYWWHIDPSLQYSVFMAANPLTVCSVTCNLHVLEIKARHIPYSVKPHNIIPRSRGRRLTKKIMPHKHENIISSCTLVSALVSQRMWPGEKQAILASPFS